MSKTKKNEMPNYIDLMIPTLEALKELGGSGSIEEINEKVYKICNFNEEVLQVPHGEFGLVKEVDYRLGWTKTYLKKAGIIVNSSRGIWALNNSNIDLTKINPKAIGKAVQEGRVPVDIAFITDLPNNTVNSTNSTEIVEVAIDWKETLLDVLQNIKPDAFERLAMRLLRESGFTHVEVTGKSNDGGIDGKGIVKISGLLSFHIIFQCKRYKGSIVPSQIRDFRGAMQGRADKGLFITTGTFTREATKEATRDGAPPIDLIDGELLCEKLKELNLGVETQLVEKVEINEKWFNNI